jgi:acyl-coenzyme A thioesterase PaaI-like protein
VRFDEHHQGGPGLVHGGVVAAALDEAAGLLATWHRFPAVTAQLDVRFRRPAPINRPLALAAWIVRERSRRLDVEAELRDGETLLAAALVAFMHVPLEHFLATPEGQAAAEAWRRRLE